jgi:hypothetical protein
LGRVIPASTEYLHGVEAFFLATGKFLQVQPLPEIF